MQSKTLTPENYVMRFCKYKNMKAVDIADIYEVDKNGNDKAVGLMYLKFLVMLMLIVCQLMKKNRNNLNM